MVLDRGTKRAAKNNKRRTSKEVAALTDQCEFALQIRRRFISKAFSINFAVCLLTMRLPKNDKFTVIQSEWFNACIGSVKMVLSQKIWGNLCQKLSRVNHQVAFQHDFQKQHSNKPIPNKRAQL